MVLHGIDSFFATMSSKINPLIFFDILPGAANAPFVIALLAFGCIFFSFKTGFVNIKEFTNIFNYKHTKANPNINGISPYAALSTGIGGSVGLGSIAGVAVAISMGGPGVVFWIAVAGFLSMPFRFAEVYFANKYRVIDKNGEVITYGPFAYIIEGIKSEFNKPKLGVYIASAFALFFVIASFSGPNAFQSNQSVKIASVIFFNGKYVLPIALFLAVISGLVIIGGIKRIAKVAELLVNSMGIVYFIAIFVILFVNKANLSWAFAEIFKGAFNISSISASFIPIIVIAVKRSLFANEVGEGTVPMAHGKSVNASAYDEAIKSMAGPFFCSVIICSLSGLILVASKSFLIDGLADIEMVKHAYLTVHPYFVYILPTIVFLFAYSTILSWYYYGESAFVRIFAKKYVIAYKIAYCCFIVIGGTISFGAVLDFMDFFIFAITIPNVVVLCLLASKTKFVDDRVKDNK
jgi:alanine or glycine:cation symporter, AGCS family